MAASKQTSNHTYACAQCSPASVGLTQARPNYCECKRKVKNGEGLGMRLTKRHEKAPFTGEMLLVLWSRLTMSSSKNICGSPE